MEQALFTRKTDGGFIVTPPTCEVKMVDGGVQIRYKLPTGGKISISESPAEGKFDKAHYHKGLMEIYVVHKGALTIFRKLSPWKVGETQLTAGKSSCIFCVEPNIGHGVFQHPGTIFTVQTIGAPVPNPERGNNDWWPVPPE